jgi:hypothetical protein
MEAKMEIIKDPKLHAALELLNAYAKEKADDIGDLISKNYTDLRDSLTKGAKTAVKDYPWAVIGGAVVALVGLGLLIGATTSRKRE